MFSVIHGTGSQQTDLLQLGKWKTETRGILTGDSSLLDQHTHAHKRTAHYRHSATDTAALPFLKYLPQCSAAQLDSSPVVLPTVQPRHVCSKDPGDSAQVTQACHCSCTSKRMSSVWAEGSHRRGSEVEAGAKSLFNLFVYFSLLAPTSQHSK